MSDDASDPLVREQEAAAAREAGAVGGNVPGDPDDPNRAVDEGGGGVAEGFEQAEADLIAHAEHTSGEGIPRLDQMGEEAEPDPATYGEPDELDTTEKTSDPRSGSDDDPGEGPGIAAER